MATSQSEYRAIYDALLSRAELKVTCGPQAQQKLRTGLNRARNEYQDQLRELGDDDTIAPKYSMTYLESEGAVQLKLKSHETGEFSII